MKKKIILAIIICIMVQFVSAAIPGSSSSKSDLSGTTAITISLVNQDPDPALAGEIVEVRVGITNTGGSSANNLIVELVPEYPFELISGESAVQNVGTIKGYQDDENMKIIKHKVKVNKDATAGSYDLKLKYYIEGSYASIQKGLSIDVQSKESAEVIYIDKTLLVPGQEDSLSFIINNVGSAPLRDLTFNWVNDDKVILPVGSDNTKYIKYIDIGESAELEYKVIADTNADAGLYELSLQLIYDDPLTGEEKEIDTIAGIYVGGGTDFDVAFSESSSGTTSFTIANVGSNPASSVSVIIPEQQGWKVSGSNSMIIGNLNTGDYTVASFSLSSQSGFTPPTQDSRQAGSRNISSRQSDTQSQNSLKVRIAYTDTRGKREVIEKEIAMSTQNIVSSSTTDSEESSTDMPSMGQFRRMRQQSFFSKYKWYILMLVVLSALGFGYWKYKKKKIEDPDITIKEFFKIKNLLPKKRKK